ncbi:MAG: antitoxin HicB [Candidatus Levybacteria bacterium RBG_16_35_6]|nr:MAG: antitoxin HicB [Candidatus Levybacteria bacterium RBG_16_35_6]
MKTTELNYSVIFRKEPEGGFTVLVPSLPGCVTYGKDLDEARKMAREAIELYLESLKEHKEEVLYNSLRTPQG